MLSKNTKKVSIEFKLTDTGIGIRKNKLEHIFNNFEQAYKETSSSYGGTGLGLAIVKQLVELQGGSIIVSSELGKGSTFGFVLDFETTQPNTQIEEESNLTNAISANEELQNIKVLVAEDMALNQLLIKIILADLNFVVDIAENGKIAVNTLVANSLANQVPYDIILMDLQMPEMNGFEATTYIRQELKSNIPIIALTADVTTVDVDKCLAVGMNDYISKPIDEKLLYSKMIKCLKKQAIYNEST
jgi:two-component system CheB/CheR fusion protein